ncbi:unnamed protein product [Prunus brigantina]
METFMLLELVGTLWEAQKLFFRNVKLMFSIFLLIISLSSILFVSNMFSIKQLITDFAHETSLVPAMDATFLVPSLLIFDLTFTMVASITVFLLALVFQAYLAVVWNLELVVSVLEEICGIEALGKAEQLIKGSK